jgi:hypothetical protein
MLQESQAFQYQVGTTDDCILCAQLLTRSIRNDLNEWTHRISARSPVHGCDFLRAQLQQAH